MSTLKPDCIVAWTILWVASAALPATLSAQLDDSALQSLEWRNIGPANMSGRVTDFAVAKRPGAADVLYVASASGGLFRTTDAGASWTPVFDGVDGMISIGDVAVAPSSPNVVWVGSGEANNRQSSSWGAGVYKSPDGGDTWVFVGLEETRHIGRIVIHPDDPNIVFVAAVGHLWGSNPERGVFKTTDGGQTWEKVLYVDEHTGAVDLAIDPHDPNTVFAAMYQRQRRAWGFIGGGPGSGIYRTRDGGATWEELAGGLPERDLGRIGLAIYPQDPRIVYAIVQADAQGGDDADAERVGGVYRSADGGETWEHRNPINPRPMYYSQIRVDPRESSRVYVLGSSFHVSDDGGLTFTEPGYGAGGVHPDQHALWIDPENPEHLVLGNDGGVAISRDRGQTWRFIDNLPIGQFYEIAVDMRDPYWVCGGLQDNASWCIPSATRYKTGISNHDAVFIGSGDGFHAEIDPNDHTIIFTESQGGNLTRLDLTTGERQMIQPVPLEQPIETEDGEEEGDYRWDWNSPVILSHHDPATVYFGANVLFRSRDRGRTWEVISPDLTTAADRDTLEMMGLQATEGTLSRHDGTSSYPNLTTIAESPLDPAVLYTGSDDGQVHVSRDGGATWTNVTANIPDLPRSTYVTHLAASVHAPGRVYAGFDGHWNDDYSAYVFVSENHGEAWERITAGLPETSVNVVIEDPENPDLLFVGHEQGVHVSIDRGESWASLNANMPSVPVDALVIHPRERDLVAGTHGRGIWILDDITPLEGLTPSVAQTEARLLPSRPGKLFTTELLQGWFQAGTFFAPNPEFGPGIAYWLGADQDSSATIRIRDDRGNIIRELEGPTRRGINRVHWDMRLEPPFEDEPGTFYGLFDHPPRGPRVLPGEYRVTVILPAEGAPELEGTVGVRADPHVRISEADRLERQTAMLDLYELQKTLDVARQTGDALSDHLSTLEEHLENAGSTLLKASTNEPGGLERVEEIADSVAQLREDVGDEFGDVNQLAGAVDGYTGAPTVDQVRQIDWAYEDVSETVAALNEMSATVLPDLYAELRDQGVWPSPVGAIPAPVRRAARAASRSRREGPNP